MVDPARVWTGTLKLYAVTVIGGLLIGGGALIWYSKELFPGVSTMLLWFALLVFPASLFLALISSIFQGLQKFGKFNLILLMQPVLTLLMIASLTLAGVRDIGILLAAYLTSSIVVSLVALQGLKPLLKTHSKVSENVSYEKKALSYGYKAHLSNILAFVNYKADIFLVNLFLGPAQAGLYVIAVQLSERLWLLSKGVSTVLLPRLSQLSEDEATRKMLTPLITRWVLLITLLGACLLGAVAYPVILLIFGSDFLKATAPLLFLLPGVVCGSASRIIANDLAARGRPELNMYTSWVVVIVNVIGNIVLIPIYGMSGAAVASSAAYAVNLFLRLVMHRSFTGVPIVASLFISRADIAALRSLLPRKS